MSMKDVRDFLVKQMAELADSDKTGQDLADAVERAKATSQVATTYISAVKTEIEAIKLLDETGRLPVAVEAPPMERQDGRVLSFEAKRSA